MCYLALDTSRVQRRTHLQQDQVPRKQVPPGTVSSDIGHSISTSHCLVVMCVWFHLQVREITLLISSYINNAHQQKAAAHHLSAPALLVAQPISLKSKELRSKSPPVLGRPSKTPTLL